MAVCNQEALRAFAALRGANPGPPFLAAAKLASTKASFSSSSLAHPSSSMSATRMRSQVPSSAHRVSHRWQVERDGYRSGMNRLAKTDQIDAELLAEFGKRLQPSPTTSPDEATRLLHALVSRRRQLVDMRSMEQMRLKQARAKTLVRSIERTVAFLTK